MAGSYFEPGAQRAAKVGDLFDAISGRYDLLNDLQSFGLHRLWKRRLVRMAGVRHGDRALDVCCGTGDIALALARLGAEVTGLDFSQRMLAMAERRKSKVGSLSGSVQFLHGDAQNLPFPENHFDVVTVGYGLRNLASWKTGLRELWRVSRPGARVLVLEFGKPDHRAWRALYFGYLRLVVPALGAVFAGDAKAYAYILESLNHYPAQRGVAAEMQALLFEDVRVVNLLGGVMSINHGRKRAES